ncbi:MAG TPA: hemolysin III family protein [Chloroflexia bacterium]
MRRVRASLTTDIMPDAKPRMRGWSHAAASAGSVLLTVLLCWASRDDWPKMVAMLVFGLSMVEMYTISAIYHIGRWSERRWRMLRSIDHSNIFLLIAGTYTPLAAVMLTGWVGTALLIAVWSLALVGVGLSIFVRRLPRAIRSALYVGMGWISVLALPAFLQVLPLEAIGLLVLGGGLYTVGAVIYARRRPDPFPRTFGFHEVFHLLVIAGNLAFVAVMVLWVLPYRG